MEDEDCYDRSLQDSDDDFLQSTVKVFFLYIQFTLFQTNLQSPGTYISKRTWDPSQKAITK